MEALGGEDIFITCETLISSKGINSILSKSTEGGACCSSLSQMYFFIYLNILILISLPGISLYVPTIGPIGLAHQPVGLPFVLVPRCVNLKHLAFRFAVFQFVQ